MNEIVENEWATLGFAGRNTYRVSDRVVDMRRSAREVRPIAFDAQPQALVIDGNRTALVVIDMTNDFCGRDGWIGSMGIDLAPAQALIGPVNRVARALRAVAAPVIWLNWGVRADRANLTPGTQHPFNPNGKGAGLSGKVVGTPREHSLLQKDSWGAALVDGLERGPDDIDVDKHRISGFWDTPLDAILRNADVTTVLFAGVNADHCVLGTLMDANFAGYDTILIEDATATTSPDFCMQATLHNVRFCFGFTATSTAVVDGFLK